MEAIKKAVFGSYDQPQDTTDDSAQNNNTTPDSYKQEPISGVQGDTSKGEPFDAGNMSPQPTSAEASNLHDNKETTTSDNKETTISDNKETTTSDNKETTTSDNKETTTSDNKETTTSDSNLSPSPNAATVSPSTTTPEPTAESNLTAHKEPSTKMQTDPSSTKNVTEDHPAATDDNDEPQPDISGPGPRPISQVAAEHGGRMPEPESASARTRTSTSTSTSISDSKKKGGDKYVSSGFAATGGNFDAAHPGAGQEALRLMHEPGQHKTFDEVKEDERHQHHHHQLHLPGHDGKAHSGEHAQPQVQSAKNGDVQTADQGGSGKAKLGEKIEKIKNKLHIRSKDKESDSTTL